MHYAEAALVGYRQAVMDHGSEDQKASLRGSAAYAKFRLGKVVSSDRAECGDGRWVQTKYEGTFLVARFARKSTDPKVQEQVRSLDRLRKPRFRWEWRQ